MNSHIHGLRRSGAGGKAGRSRRGNWRKGLLAIALCGGVVLAGGCNGPQNGAPAGERTVAATTLGGSSPQRVADDYYLIGPLAARDLGYRIDWQQHTLISANSGIKTITVQGDSVFVMDGRNFLSRLRREDGEQLWRVPVADALDEIHGITFMPRMERVFITSGGVVLVLDSDTGSQIAKQRLSQIANTEPIVFGQFFLYGARNGQICWHSYQIGHQWRGYQVSQSIQLAPLLVDGAVIVVGSDGRIMVLDVGSASQIWSKKLLDVVTAPPAAGSRQVYVAGQDQHLWAFDLNTGRNTWRYLTEDPLTEGPVLLGDQVY
ncbi:MAG: PQQ-binding-like beta-propeller repeat protein, partial [Phycisphaerales bacterium]